MYNRFYKNLSFEATLLVSFNNITLQDEEDNDQRQDSQSSTNKQLVQVEHLGVEEVGEHHLHRPGRRILTNDQRPEEGVPTGDKSDYAQCRDDTPGVRHHHAPENSPVTQTIHTPGFLQFFREAEEELTEQESGKTAEQAGHHQTLERADPTQPRNNNVDRHENHREGDHQGHQDRIEDCVRIAIRNTSQAITRQRGNQHLPCGLQDCNDGRVFYADRNGTSGSLSSSEIFSKCNVLGKKVQ